MTSDRPHEAVQDAAHVTPGSASAASNVLDTVFNFSQLEGKDAGQQVRPYNKLPCALRANALTAGHSQPYDGKSCQYQGGSGGSTTRKCRATYGSTLLIAPTMWHVLNDSHVM
jgi:hypothetical protein